jgi:DNA-binding MarR family transcriptional regulator
MDRVSRDAALLQELYTAGALVNLLVTEELDAAGVPAELFSFLGWIAQLQPVTPGRLSAETGLPPTTIRDYVRRSVALGTVRKRPNPEDGRSYHLALTASGKRLMDRGWPAVKKAFLRLERELDRPAGHYLECVREIRAGLKRASSGAAAPLQPSPPARRR